MKIKDARVRAGLKVQDVAEKFGITEAAVYMWESGQTQPDVSKLKKLAGLYQCSIDDLLEDAADDG